MLTVACVLRSGREFFPEHVEALQRQVFEHLPEPHRFVCLTDMDVFDCITIRLKHRWKGWWSKLELFRSNVFRVHPVYGFGPVLYLDLDTVIAGDLTPLAQLAKSGAFAMNDDFYHPGRLNSALMCWSGNALTPLYERFLADPGKVMLTHGKAGDQAFIAQCVKDGIVQKPVTWQTELPGMVVSYKVHVRPSGTVPEGARVICYHGQPRPWEVPVAA